MNINSKQHFSSTNKIHLVPQQQVTEFLVLFPQVSPKTWKNINIALDSITMVIIFTKVLQVQKMLWASLEFSASLHMVMSLPVTLAVPLIDNEPQMGCLRIVGGVCERVCVGVISQCASRKVRISPWAMLAPRSLAVMRPFLSGCLTTRTIFSWRT